MPLYKIEHENRQKFCLFVHIPKTGGSSIAEIFKLLKFRETYGYDNNFRKLLKETPQHFTYNTLNNLVDISKLDFSFTIMRDPFDKIISSYFWSKNHTNTQDILKKINFETWFNNFIEIYKQNKNVLSNHLIPQSEFVGQNIKKIYKFEDGVHNIFIDVLKSLNLRIKEDYSFPHALKTSEINRPEIDEIKGSKNITKMIYSFYKEDFDLYDKLF